MSYDYKKIVFELVLLGSDEVVRAFNDMMQYYYQADENPEPRALIDTWGKFLLVVRISASIRETFRAGGAFSSIPVMSQRDLTIKWAIGAGKAKEPLIEKGHIVDDGGAFFGWGVEQGHLGKTEIFCKFDPLNTEAKEAVEEWHKAQSKRAFDEKYFALLMGPQDEIGPGMSNYHLWWDKIRKTLDPNDVTPDAGSLV